MSIIIYLFLLVLLLILLVLFTAIGLTFKFTALGLEERKEFRGTFTIKWLLFSHSFSFQEPKAKESFSEVPAESKPEKEVVIGQEDWQDKRGFEYKTSAEKIREIGEKTPEERMETKEETTIKGKGEKEKKRSPIDKIRGKKGVKKEDQVEPETGMTAREKLYWGLKAYRCLKKPLFRLFSDMLHGIKIKRLDSCLTFGLSDPADTGMLCGFIHTVAGLIYSRCKHCGFSINPVFLNPMLDFRGDAEIRVRIYSMIFPFIKFIFNRNTLSFTYSVVKELFQRKWESEWEPKWKAKWKSKWKSNS